MSKFTPTKEKQPAYKLPVYPKHELDALNTLLKVKYNNGMKNNDITKWLQDEGALTKWGAVLSYPPYLYPTKYDVLLDKLSQAGSLLGRKQWAVKKDLESLDTIAESMKIKN